MVAALGACLGVLAPSGCSTSATTTLHSESGAGDLNARMTVLAYTSIDPNTADIYMSDLPRPALEPDADLTSVSGQFVHMHIFMTPEAGHTPIDPGACSVVVRTFVLARGQIGLYGGGAFLDPDNSLGGGSFSGSITGGTARLLNSTGGFIDKLGPSEFRAKFRVPRNEKLAEQMQKRLTTMLEFLPEVQTPLPKP